MSLSCSASSSSSKVLDKIVAMERFAGHSRDLEGSDISSLSAGVLPLKEEPLIDFETKLNGFQNSSDTSLFSSSLPVIFHKKLNLNCEGKNGNTVVTRQCDQNELSRASPCFDHPQNIMCQDVGNLPDDEEELLAGIIDGFDINGLLSEADESDEYDLFSSGGGMELDFDNQETMNRNLKISGPLDHFSGNGNSSHALSSGVGGVPGEHPYGEHPSRTLFVRNINSNVEDSELRALFEQYGTIRTLYTACKHRGFVMISYYDIRAARSAMRALQNKPLRRRKLDIHFSIPKDNPSDKDVNQGTLVVFNLDPSVSNEDLLHIFGAFGEVKEIRETPHKRHHKFIEFYDVRAAENALRHLNKSDIAGKRIKLEPSRPGGARRSMMQQLSQELEYDETRSFRLQVDSPMTNSPPVSNRLHFNSPSPVDDSTAQNIQHSSGIVNGNLFVQKPLPGLTAVLPSVVSSPQPMHRGIEMGGAVTLDPSSLTNMNNGTQFHHPHSYPENGSMVQVTHYGSPVTSHSMAYGLHKGMGITSGGSFPHPKAVSVASTLSRPQMQWGTHTLYHAHNSAWPNVLNNNGLPQHQGYLYAGRHGSHISHVFAPHHHVGSAPSEESFHHGYFTESPETSFAHPRSFNGMGFVNGKPIMNKGEGGIPNNCNSDNGSPSYSFRPPQQMCHMYPAVRHPAPLSNFGDGPNERGRNRRPENNGNQVDNKKQYQLDLEKIISGEDTRTTLMIKNIPNKYTSKMLLAAIDETNRGTYDFLYLPIDFKNKCNVGYAFLNMISPSHIISFYKAFNGKKWEKFNSEKVASIAYARIQGKAALVTHFQNSSLMNEDKRCRPLLFNTNGPAGVDQEPFPLTINHKVLTNEGPNNGDCSNASLESKIGEKTNLHIENPTGNVIGNSSEEDEQ